MVMMTLFGSDASDAATYSRLTGSVIFIFSLLRRKQNYKFEATVSLTRVWFADRRLAQCGLSARPRPPNRSDIPPASAFGWCCGVRATILHIRCPGAWSQGKKRAVKWFGCSAAELGDGWRCPSLLNRRVVVRGRCRGRRIVGLMYYEYE